MTGLLMRRSSVSVLLLLLACMLNSAFIPPLTAQGKLPVWQVQQVWQVDGTEGPALTLDERTGSV